MNTEAVCPRCKNEFNSLENNTVCHRCHEIECVAEFIMEKAESRGWENAQFFAQNRYGEAKTKKAMEYIKSQGSIDDTKPYYENQ